MIPTQCDFSATCGMSSQRHTQAGFPPGKCLAPIVAGWVRGPGWTSSASGNLLPAPGFEPRPVASQYTVSYPNTYVLTPRSRVLLEQLTGPRMVKKLPAFYGTQRFITAIHKLLPPVSTLRQINPVHSSIFLKIHFNITPNLRLGLSNGVFPSRLPCIRGPP